MSTPAPRVGYVRWIICLLLFLAATINYIDRQVLGLLKVPLQEEFGWSEIDYADIVFSFQLAYAIGFLIAGKFIDKVGTRIGFATAIIVWSLAAIGHAEAPEIGAFAAPLLAMFGMGYSTSVAGFIAMRFLLGVGEAGNFPASIKTVAEWFPKKERAFATGLFNSGTNIGALITPLVVPWITVTYGWYWAFVITGLIGFVWLLFWLFYYAPPEKHRSVSPAELALIRSDPPDPPVQKIPWRQLVRYRQVWAFAMGKFLTDPVWWVFLFWIPDFLNRNYGLSLLAMGPPIIIIYLLADVGSIGGGWLSSRFLAIGWSVNRARKTAMLVCALSVVPIVITSQIESLWVAVALVSLATAAHQGWSANLFTLTSDMLPKHALASTVGFGGMCGAVGGMLISKVTGYILEATGSYVLIFIGASVAYLFALLVIHLLVPKMEPAKF